MQPANGAEAPLTPAIIFEMLQAYQRTAALKAAIDLDVFRAVGDGPETFPPSPANARLLSAASASCAISSSSAASSPKRAATTNTPPPAPPFSTRAPRRAGIHRTIPW